MAIFHLCCKVFEYFIMMLTPMGVKIILSLYKCLKISKLTTECRKKLDSYSNSLQMKKPVTGKRNESQAKIMVYKVASSK